MFLYGREEISPDLVIVQVTVMIWQIRPICLIAWQISLWGHDSWMTIPSGHALWKFTSCVDMPLSLQVTHRTRLRPVWFSFCHLSMTETLTTRSMSASCINDRWKLVKYGRLRLRLRHSRLQFHPPVWLRLLVSPFLTCMASQTPSRVQ